ncbi:hypothetical protein [Pseudomonas syringae]|uniref:hypothetical protein n=1 Tax=Pseudomonas syringae TaxID=317 RepID=UPI003204A527
MNLSCKRIAEIRTLVSAGIQIERTEAEDLLGHNDHLTELCEARARLVLRAESESETLRGLYQIHKETETREMRDLKAENAGLKTGYEAYERVNAELRAECESLREIMSLVTSEIPHSKSVRPGNAPGHCHSVPGVWDEDNGEKAGKECAWCKVWNAAIIIKKEAAQ